MSIRKKVSLRTAIQDALDAMGYEHERENPLMMDWATKAEIAIAGANSNEPKKMVLDIDGCWAKLPKYTAKVFGLLLGDHGCDCNKLFTNFYNRYGNIPRAVYAGAFTVVDDGGGSTFSRCSGSDWSIINNSIKFEQAPGIDKVTVDAECFFVDDNGHILINENHVEAISKHLVWRFAMRKRWTKTDGRSDRMYYNEVNSIRKEWTDLAARARGEDGAPEDHERARISGMLHDLYSGNGPSLSTYYDSNNGWNSGF